MYIYFYICVCVYIYAYIYIPLYVYMYLNTYTFKHIQPFHLQLQFPKLKESSKPMLVVLFSLNRSKRVSRASASSLEKGFGKYHWRWVRLYIDIHNHDAQT